jgi:hypothetical protein
MKSPHASAHMGRIYKYAWITDYSEAMFGGGGNTSPTTVYSAHIFEVYDRSIEARSSLRAWAQETAATDPE